MSIYFALCVIYERFFNKRKIFLFSTRFTRFVFCDFAFSHNTYRVLLPNIDTRKVLQDSVFVNDIALKSSKSPYFAINATR